jgi:hypothetical protein
MEEERVNKIKNNINIMLAKTFKEEVQKKFPKYTIHKLDNTHHSNVLQLTKEGDPTLIAKTIWKIHQAIYKCK